MNMIEPPAFSESIATIMAGEPGKAFAHPFGLKVFAFYLKQIDDRGAEREHVLQSLLRFDQLFFGSLAVGGIVSRRIMVI
jgi:hypothetical protein